MANQAKSKELEKREASGPRQVERASTRAVAWFTSPKSSGMMQPTNKPTRPRSSPWAGIRSGSLRRSRRGGTDGNRGYSSRSRRGRSASPRRESSESQKARTHSTGR